MKNLDVSNPEIANPRRFGSLSSLISVMSGILGLVLAIGATPNIPFGENPLAIFCCLIILSATILFFIPRVMSWDWRARYFGITSVHLATFSLLCIIPLLCLVLYSRIALEFRMALLALSVIFHFWWVRRFVLFYRKIFEDKRLFDLLYYEVNGRVYYMQKVDKYLVENIFNFRQIPADRYLVVFLVVAISMLFFADRINSVTGLPFVYSFLTACAFPVSLMVVGLVARGWLIFYFYPWRIYRLSRRQVYVDMVDLPEDFKKKIFEWRRSLKNERFD